jgi:hypothetical protein
LVTEADSQEVEIRALDPEIFEKLQEIENPLIVPVRVVDAARDQQPVKTIEFFYGWNPTALFGHDKDLVRLNAQRWMMSTASSGEVLMDDSAKGSSRRICVWMRFVGLEDHETYNRRRWSGLVGLIHAVCLLSGMICEVKGNAVTWVAK